jgi:hypothetical protein
MRYVLKVSTRPPSNNLSYAPVHDFDVTDHPCDFDPDDDWVLNDPYVQHVHDILAVLHADPYRYVPMIDVFDDWITLPPRLGEITSDSMFGRFRLPERFYDPPEQPT